MSYQGQNFAVQGLEEALAKIEGLVERARAGAAGAAYEEGEVEMALSKRLVPIDTGALRSTGHVEPPEWRGDEVTVGLAYGGPAGPPAGGVVGYAVYVHENLEMHHEVGQAKYLEQPVREELSSGRALQRMGESIVRRLEGA